MTEFNILDCTLRDGSYVNRFQFSYHDTKNIAIHLEKCGIKFIEIGHGLGLGAYRLGGDYSSAATDEEYLQAAAEAIKASSFGMFCIPGIAKLEDIVLARSYGMKFIRIGTNVDAIKSSKPFIEKAKKLGLLVCANYMKSYAIPPREFSKNVKLSESYGADVVYLVDSAGGMLQSQIIDYIKAIKDSNNIKIGFHGHNNLGLAVANSLVAIEQGAFLIDTSLQGIGRGGGNAPTEQVSLICKKLNPNIKIDIYQLLDFGYDIISPLLPDSGLNPIDLISGFAMFHSSYLPLIRKYSLKYSVDPRKLIVELCKIDQINAPPELVEKVALKLPKIDDEFNYAKYHLEKYFVNEQGLKNEQNS